MKPLFRRRKYLITLRGSLLTSVRRRVDSEESAAKRVGQLAQVDATEESWVASRWISANGRFHNLAPFGNVGSSIAMSKPDDVPNSIIGRCVHVELFRSSEFSERCQRSD